MGPIISCLESDTGYETCAHREYRTAVYMERVDGYIQGIDTIRSLTR